MTAGNQIYHQYQEVTPATVTMAKDSPCQVNEEYTAGTGRIKVI
jgi:hypothetical protein